MAVKKKAQAKKTRKSKLASELGRRGGVKGGAARAAALTSSQKREAARVAAQARWDEKSGIVRALRSASIKIGEAELQCAVLPGPDGGEAIRVVSTRTVTKALGRYRPGGRGGAELPVFLGAQNLRPFIKTRLLKGITDPVYYRDKGGLAPAHGMHAELLTDICEVYLDARNAGVLKPSQMKHAAAAEMLLRGFAKTGIVALVDEATGYQYDRGRDALAKYLAEFINKELARWVKTFDDEYYEELCRLWNRPPSDIVKRPPFFGKLTNMIVYDRLAPGLTQELRRVNPVQPSGHRKSKHHQRLTRDKGHPKLREHLHAVITLMRISSDKKEFLRHLDRAFPKYDPNLSLPGIK